MLTSDKPHAAFTLCLPSLRATPKQGTLFPLLSWAVGAAVAATVDISVNALGLPVSALPRESLSLKLPDLGVFVKVQSVM